MLRLSHAVMLAACCTPATAIAQTSLSPDVPPTGAIIVTGTRAADPLPAGQFGGSVTLLDAQTLEWRQTRSVAEILRDVPGVALGQVPGQTQIRLRGSEANHVLVLVDGIEVADPVAGEFDFTALIAEEAARIEVLRGPQSAIYGSDAIGGVVHYIALSGREAPGASARVEAGSFGTVNAAARVAGLAGAVDYALSGALNTSDGTPGARGGRRDLANDTGALSLKTTWSPEADARLTGVARYSHLRADFNDSDGDFTSPTFGFQIDTPGNYLVNEAAYALLRGEIDLLAGRWSHALSGQVADTTRDGFTTAGRSYGSKGQRLKGSYDSTLRLGSGPIRHDLVLALDLERERFRNTDPSGFASTARRQSDNAGLVGQYQLFLGDRAGFSAAIRRDWNDRFANSTTYRLQGSYRLPSDTRLRAAAGSGIKNPSFYELFGFIDGRFIGNPGLRPERSEGWEVGLEQRAFAGSATLGLTWFDSTLSGEIFTAFPPPTFLATPGNRESRSRQHGLEAFAQARIDGAWQLDAAYTWLDSREEGQPEVRRPNHTGSLALGWRARQPSGEDRGGLTLVARYVGESRDLAFIDPSFVPVRVRLDDFLLVNLNADLRLTERLELFGRIENLTGEVYETVFSFRNPGRAVTFGARARL